MRKQSPTAVTPNPSVSGPEPIWPPIYEPQGREENVALRRYVDAAARFAAEEKKRPKDEDAVLDALGRKRAARLCLLGVFGARVNRWFVIDDVMVDMCQPEAGGPVGRKLDFLCQELNREANTLCSKSSDVELTRVGLDLKVAIEQLREQVQNIE